MKRRPSPELRDLRGTPCSGDWKSQLPLQSLPAQAEEQLPPCNSCELWVGIGLTAAAFLLYAVTLTPGVPPTDSGELILAAWLPGNAHAPGFPLWVIVGWLWSHLLPVGRVAWRLNLLSAFCGALAVGLAYALALRTLGRTVTHSGIGASAQPPCGTGNEKAPLTPQSWGEPGSPKVGGRGAGIYRTASESSAARGKIPAGDRLPALAAPSGPGKARFPRGSSALAAAAVGAAALGLGRTAWAWATVAEVYTLSLALAAAVLLLLNTQSPIPNTPFLILAAFLFGLGLGGHLTSMALLAPAIALWLTIRHGPRVWWSRTALFAGLALVAGAGVYLYLPLAASADPLLNWGNPDTWQRFWWHVTARQYRVSLFSSPVGPQVLLAARLWWTQFTPVGLGLLLLGAWQMFRRQRELFWTLALIVLFTTFYAWAYVIEDDQDAYYLPAFLAGAVWVAWGVEALFRVVQASIFRAVVCLLVVALALAMNWRACNRRFDTIPEDYVRDTFAEIAPAGLLLTRDWQLVAPALYLQHIEGLRPDLTVIDTELLRRRWYFDYLHKVDPGLMNSVAAEEQAFLGLRDSWERGEIHDGDPRIARLQAAYVALLDAFIREAEAAGRPVHIGPNRGAAALRPATLAGRLDMEPGVGGGRNWLPVGLSFRAIASPPEEGVAKILPPLAWQVESFRQVVPGAPERKIQATRADMATLRGLVLANAGELDRAGADWRIALAVDPAHEPAQEYLRRLDTMRNK